MHLTYLFIYIHASQALHKAFETRVPSVAFITMGFGKKGSKGGKSNQAWSNQAWGSEGGEEWAEAGAGSWSEGGKGWRAPAASSSSWGKADKGKGKKGKGKDKEEAMDPSDFTSRIKSSYQVAKVILRASIDDTGGAFVKSDWAKTDTEILDFANFAATLSTGNCHLLRRPGVGLSEFAGTLSHGMEVLNLMNNNLQSLGFPALDAAVSDKIMEALQCLNQKGVECDRSKAKLAESLQTLLAWVKENEDLYDKAKDAAIASARLYLMATSLLQFLVCAGDTTAWAELVPGTNSDAKEFHAWKEAPSSARKTGAALATLIVEATDQAKLWGSGKGNSAVSTFGQVSRRADKDKDKDDNSAADDDEKEKTKNKKQDKKGADDEGKKKKDKKKKKKSKKSSSSSASSSRSSASKKASDASEESEKKSKKANKKEKKAKKDDRSDPPAPAQKVARQR